MKISRRYFSIGSASLILSGSVPYKLLANSMNKKKNLIVIMLRGAMDGLSAVPYVHDNTLQKMRPDIFVKNNLKLNSDFNLHPKLFNFQKLWKESKASIIHATNIPYTERSHFDGQNLMESGGTIPYKLKTGWLGRGIDVAGLEGLSISLPMPLLLRGESNHDNFFPSNLRMPSQAMIDIMQTHFQSEKNINKSFNKLISRPLSMMSGRKNKRLAYLASIAGNEIKKEDGPRVAVFEVFGFDTHAAQGGADGEHGQKLKQIDITFASLKNTLGKAFDDTLIITLTEFGRSLVQNNGYGTEHGYGSAILMGGGLLKKSQIYTDWPGIKKQNLYEGRDLNSTLDSRAVYCAAMSACFDVDFKKLNKEVFPDKKLPDLTEKLFKV